MDGEALKVALAADDVAARSLAIARRQQAAGQGATLAVLADEAAERQTRLAVLQARAAQDGDVAALYQALGGGWWNEAEAQRASR
jgi:outer membrane protein TolC